MNRKLVNKPSYKKLHIPTKMKRAVFLIEMKKEQADSGMEMMKSLFGVQSNDFITAVDEKNMILIKSFPSIISSSIVDATT